MDTSQQSMDYTVWYRKTTENEANVHCQENEWSKCGIAHILYIITQQ